MTSWNIEVSLQVDRDIFCPVKIQCAKLRHMLGKSSPNVVIIFISSVTLHKVDCKYLLPQSKTLIYAIDIIQDYVILQ